tara:strand:- start:588 stop:782 length:195 start_codon:yes stop_codon:yes gene_type:complete
MKSQYRKTADRILRTKAINCFATDEPSAASRLTVCLAGVGLIELLKKIQITVAGAVLAFHQLPI